MLNRPVEIYNLMKILRPDLVPSFRDYAQRYCDPKDTPYGLDYSGNSCTKELHFLLNQNFMIRRLKKDVLHELPEKRRQKIQITVDEKMTSQIKKMLNNMMNEMGSGEAFSEGAVQSLITDYSTNFSDYMKRLKDEEEEA
jgi:SWI/SNF-related matrix-associated actin-dependent regulator 1 of chromatin subfamily A